ncbi:unnamed protein product [Meganyctiphanes norvegica]|uniref:ShKT domain-containing protein n=1 Tax=Meganyctiphanes norvegica TaxID=48144 RepID=A0AAV2QFE2_MEGNR
MRSSFIFLVLVVIMRCSGQWLPPASPRANDVCTDQARADFCESLRIRGYCGEGQKFCRRTCGLCLPSRREHIAREYMMPEDVMDEMTFDPQHLDIFSGQHMEEGDILLPNGVTLEDILGGITSEPSVSYYSDE